MNEKLKPFSISYSFNIVRIGLTKPVIFVSSFETIGCMKPELGKLRRRNSRLSMPTIMLQMLQQHIVHCGQHGFAKPMLRPMERNIMTGKRTQMVMTIGFILSNISSGVFSYERYEPIPGMDDMVLLMDVKKF